MILFLVSLAAVDVEHGGDASTELGGDASLVKFHVLYDASIEGREETEEVGRIIHRTVVELNQVLVGGTATHVQPAGGFAHGLYARKCLYYLDDVQFAEGCRDGF